MAKELAKTIAIPEGVNVSYTGNVFIVTGPKGSVERQIWYPGINVQITDSEVLVDSAITRRKQKAMVGTFTSHINNMIKGVTDGFEYKMTIVYAHFPMQVKAAGNVFTVGNFLGEKKPRTSSILGETKVKVSGSEVVVSGINKEDVGQTAANIEQMTKIKRFDPRVFQDGIYIVEKA